MAPSRSGDPDTGPELEAGELRRPRGTAGASRVGCLISLLVLIVGGYVAVLIVGGEIDYRQLAGEVQRQAGLAAEQEDQVIREAIAARVEDLQLPAAAGQATIRRFPENRIQIIIQYPDAIEFFGQWQWVRTRRIQVDQTY